MIRILFINAIDTAKEVQTRYPPIGIGYLIASLEKELGAENLAIRYIDSEVEEAIDTFKPEIVGISAVSQNFDIAKHYAHLAKERKAFVICGGVHISMMPATLTADMDIGVIGEGEATLCELVRAVTKIGNPDQNEYGSIKGIVYRRADGVLVRTARRPPIRNLDTLPLPARGVFKPQKEAYIFTARGCPHKCIFCASTRFWQGVRTFSPERIADEVLRLSKEFGAKEVGIFDDIFPLSPRRIRDTISALETRGVLGKVSFTCSMRADMVNEENLALLAKMGVTMIGIGMESGCQRTLSYLKGGGVTVCDNQRAIEMIRAQGIGVHGSFIIGAPDETYGEAKETYSFIKRNRLRSFSVYPLTPLPGTPIWEYATCRKLVDENTRWSQLNVEYSGKSKDRIFLPERMTEGQLDTIFSKLHTMRRWNSVRRAIRVSARNPTKPIIYLLKRKWRSKGDGDA